MGVNVEYACATMTVPLPAPTTACCRMTAADMSKSEQTPLARERFWEYVEPVQQKLYNFILKSLNFSEDAKDVFHNVVLRGWTYFHSFQPDKNFCAWIYAIAHNEIKKHYKKNARQLPLPDPDLLAAENSPRPTQQAVDVYVYAEQLKPKQREVFFLYYYNGFAVAEISRITGLGEGNVKFILSQARQNLKKLLGEANEI